MAFSGQIRLPAQEKPPAVPEDLLDDDHFREEIGINNLTTPSIQKIFEQLSDLGKIPYEDVQMKVDNSPDADRLAVSLHLGVIIANGFLSVQCERFGDMESLGKGVLDRAELLGTGKHLRPHSKALLEHASLRETEKLKKELVRTQRDIEREMADLRDVDIAHLVSLGGWLRAFQIGCVTVNTHFKEASARKIARTDIIDYYLAQLATLHPNLQKRPVIIGLRKDLTALQEDLDVPEGTTITPEQVVTWKKKADALIALIMAKNK